MIENDSAAFMAAAGEAIVAGSTGTNVNDICFALVSGG
jgi:glycerate-2-kinase